MWRAALLGSAIVMAAAATPVQADEFEEFAIVVFLSDETFDALELDETGALFGDPELVAAGGAAVPPLGSMEADVDGDGTLDLVVVFSIDEAIFAGSMDVFSPVVEISGIPPVHGEEVDICVIVSPPAADKKPMLICVPPLRK
jgi:hypothetical protein